MNRYAAIDLGSNTILLLIVERTSIGDFSVLLEKRESTRLLSSVSSRGMIDQEGEATLRQALERIAGYIREYEVDEVACCATQVFRAADNGEEIVGSISEDYGWQIDIISGEKEARLSFLSAALGLSGFDCQYTVLDVGGGSSEIISGAPDQIEYLHSYPVGAISITEQHDLDQPLKSVARDACLAGINALLSQCPQPSIPPERPVIAVGGTAVTLAGIAEELQNFDREAVHGVRLTMAQLEELVDRLAVADLDSRRRMMKFDPARAEIIVGGSLLLLSLLRRLGGEVLTVSNRGLRWGVLIDKLDLGKPATN